MAAMLAQMGERGPDSAGIAIYNDASVGQDGCKLTLQHDCAERLTEIRDAAIAKFPGCHTRIRGSHCVIESPESSEQTEDWARTAFADAQLMSLGKRIEIFKEKGHPAEFAERYQLEQFTGSHALAHTRMATESAITTSHSHPFSTGLDLCLVHNGSLSNHNRLREKLRKEGIHFQTDNDSEVAAGFLTWRLRLSLIHI